MRHGTTTGYRLHGCRCEQCREAQRDALSAYRRERGVQPRQGQQPLKHGSLSAYQRYGCRCDACREFNSAYVRALRAKRRATA